MGGSREGRVQKRSADRAAKWHEENDEELRHFLIYLALPELAPPPSAEDLDYIERLVRTFTVCRPTITGTDIMGLIVVRLTSEYLPAGELTELNCYLANVKALALARKAAPEQMLAAGFTAREIVLPPLVPEGVLGETALRVRQRWLAWYRDVLNPYGEACDERQIVVRGLARLKCFRSITGEAAAARRAQELLDADLRRRGLGWANLDAEDIVSEIYTLDSGQYGRARLIELRKDGFLAYRPRAMRDVVRKAKHGASVRPEAVRLLGCQRVAARRRDPRRGWRDIYVRDLSERGQVRGDDPVSSAELAEFRARILDVCDEVDRFIVEHWEESNAEIGRRLGTSGQAIGKRRGRILETGARLMGPSD